MTEYFLLSDQIPTEMSVAAKLLIEQLNTKHIYDNRINVAMYQLWTLTS